MTENRPKPAFPFCHSPLFDAPQAVDFFGGTPFVPTPSEHHERRTGQKRGAGPETRGATRKAFRPSMASTARTHLLTRSSTVVAAAFTRTTCAQRTFDPPMQRRGRGGGVSLSSAAVLPTRQRHCSLYDATFTPSRKSRKPPHSTDAVSRRREDAVANEAAASGGKGLPRLPDAPSSAVRIGCNGAAAQHREEPP